MQKVLSDQTRLRAAILAEALEETVAELRLIDAADLISYIRTSQWGNVADLVQSSSELSFKDGTLTFACAADFEVAWDEAPSVSLHMEFQTRAVSAFFKLVLDRSGSSVQLENIWFAVAPESVEAGTLAFAAAVSESRLRRSEGRHDAA